MNNASDQHHHHQSVIGDILLHSQSKTIIVQVIIHSPSSTTSSSIPEKPIIRRFSPSSSGSNGSRTIVPCDLKNTVLINVPHDQVRTSKKLVRMQKAGVALVKELKSKVKRSDSSASKTSVAQKDLDDERTNF